jgi:filamentous hemagglutinin
MWSEYLTNTSFDLASAGVVEFLPPTVSRALARVPGGEALAGWLDRLVGKLFFKGASKTGGAIISEGKLGYLFGQATGRAHNLARAAENAAQLSRIGVRNTAEGRALIQAHLEQVAADSSTIVRSFANEHGSFVVRESLFSGPGGFLKLESTWEVMQGGANRLTTVIPFGG